MNKNTALIIFSFLIIVSCKSNKEINEKKTVFENIESNYRIMFYNLENLYDISNDPDTNDDEFTPEGSRYWTNYRFKTKLNNIYKVIAALGGWDLPAIIGVAEIENRYVLEALINETPLHKSDYNIIHYDSPDARGIDVAMIYREKKFKPYFHKKIPVVWSPNIGTGTTRDILLVSGVTDSNDTLNIFVNHWPSRWGGQMETEGKRMYVASLVKKNADSIFNLNSNSNIIIMGDLNDYPTDRSLIDVLKTETQFEKIISNKLYNLSYYLQEVKKTGTHKYDGQWGMLDQIIVSGALLDTKNKIYTTVYDVHVFDADFLLEPDERYTGQTTNRTYIGYKYHGGFSDHLPTFVDLKKK